MKPSKLLIHSLKRYLRHRRVSYRDLAVGLGQSESNVKRIFSQEAFSLDALERICEVAGTDLFELARMSHPEREQESQIFTLAQEQALARDSKLFVFFYLLLGGLSARRIAEHYQFSKAEMTKCLVRLDKLGLIKLFADDKVRLLASKNIRWIGEGPLNRLYHEDVKREFVSSQFANANERMRFLNGRLSKHSLQALSKRMDRLIAEFVEYVELDRATAPEETHHIWFLMAYRPWKFSIVSRYKRRP